MYTNPESLKEVHEQIKEALEEAGRKSSGFSPSAQAQQVAFHFRTAIDARRQGLSEALYKVDLAMQGHDDDAMRAAYEMYDLMGETNPRVMTDAELTERFVQQTADGYKVYDSRYQMWIDFSTASDIGIELMISPDLGGTPIARIRAYDPENGTSLEYEDWEITQQDIRSSYLNEWSGAPQEWREMHYQDELYGMMKTSISGAGKVSGATSAFMMANHYRASNNLFAGNFVNHFRVDGGGSWSPIRNVPGKDAHRSFGQWSKDIGEVTAKSKGTNVSKWWKRGGRACFVISVLMSEYSIKQAKSYNDSNLSEMRQKAKWDLVFGLTGFIPGIGWAISGTYFLLDAGGAFGNWGQASGFSRETVDSWIERDRSAAQEEVCKMDFEIDYVEPIEQVRMEMLQESREFIRDKTYVTSRAIYSTKRF
ncbi:hypothetical protein [uncultured Aquimarina sp.]|uniref:hypothetical protein n=1 Tax=uncultured Aquimarina sp. TaxID=575652 RepID=UPI00260F4E7F|nr:hypothetical protein [uncultured Aquimarina sp.]